VRDKTHKIGSLSINTKVLVLTITLMICSSILVSLFAVKQFEKEIMPEMDKKAFTVGESVNSLITRAVNYGIPFRSLKGMKELLDSALEDNPEIKYIAVADPEGDILYNGGEDLESLSSFFREQAGKSSQDSRKSISISGYYDSAIPIVHETNVLGSLHIGMDRMFVQNKLKDISYDIVTVLVVSFLITFEILIFITAFTISGPIDSVKKLISNVKSGNFTQYLATSSKDEIGSFVKLFNRVILDVNKAYHDLKERYIKHKSQNGSAKSDQAIDAKVEEIEKNYKFGDSNGLQKFFQGLLICIRPALFLVIFSESLSLSFFPMYVDQLYTPIAGVSRDLVIGLPISIFMLSWAISLPLGGAWSEKIGRRKPFLMGAITTAIGLTLTGMARTVYDLLLWRSVTAVGYGIVYITCQGYVTDNTTPQNRTRGMAMFLSGFFSGSLCGAAIGGILADRIGFRTTFFVSAGLSLVSALFVFYFLQDQNKDVISTKGRIKLSYFRLLFSNRRFLALTFFSAIPAKICLTGFLYYAAPLYLKFLGNNQSAIGRVLMGYGLAMILISPFTARIADALGTRKMFVVLGGILSGIALLMVHYFQNTLGVLFSIVLLGTAHAIGVSSQLTLITEICKDAGDRIGLGTVIGIYRLIERLGNISGPLVSGALIAAFGFSKAIAGIGVITVSGSVIFTLSFFLLDLLDRQKQESYVPNAK
jgi:predicted MFS family arabinose efflux permease/HAMP domain-containing protein